MKVYERERESSCEKVRKWARVGGASPVSQLGRRPDNLSQRLERPIEKEECSGDQSKVEGVQESQFPGISSSSESKSSCEIKIRKKLCFCGDRLFVLKKQPLNSD